LTTSTKQGANATAILKKFRPEIDERLQTIVSGVLAIEAEPSDAEQLAAVFRETHTLKGISTMLGAPVIRDLVHRTEDVLEWMRDGHGECTPRIAEVLLAAVDQITRLFDEAVETGAFQPTASAAVTEQLGLLDGLMDGAPQVVTAAATPAASPTVAPVAPAAEPVAPVRSNPRETVRVASRTLDSLVALSRELSVESSKARTFLSEIKQLRRLAGETRGALAAPVNGSGDAVAQRQLGDKVGELSDRLVQLFRDYDVHARQLVRQADDMGHAASDTRMVPILRLFDGFQRLVRDLSRDSGHDVRFVIEGGQTVLDRRVIDELQGPLVHAIRNTFEHAFEPAAQRENAGKPAQCTLTLRAYHRGGFAVIEVADDGRGIDPGETRRAAVRKGLIDEAAAARMSDDEALYLVFAAGFTTRETVAEGAGRGVGLDAVKVGVERLEGRITVESELSVGTCIALEVPLVMSIVRALLIRVGDHSFAIPTNKVERAVGYSPADVSVVGGREAILVDGTGVPLVELSRVLRLATPAQGARSRAQAVVLSHLGQRMAFAIDDLVSEDTVIVRPLGSFFGPLDSVTGATILGDGTVAIVLQAGGLLRAAGGALAAVDAGRPAAAAVTATVLVVDDSLTTRELLRSLLESAGHQVEVAVNGVDGLEKARGRTFDLVVTDLDMPEMNGLELTRRLRADAQYERKPILIMTTRDHPDDKRQGMEAGASAYLCKGSFAQQSFLDTVAGFVT